MKKRKSKLKEMSKHIHSNFISNEKEVGLEFKNIESHFSFKT